MISFRRREDIAPSALILLSIILLTGTLLYMLLVPPPSVAGQVAAREQAMQQLQRETADAKRQARQAQAALGSRLWHGDSDTISAAVLALLTEQTRQHALKLGAFRPQRPQALSGVTDLPISVQITGPYPRVQAVMAALDAPNTSVALRSAEIAASDETSDAVTATLGVSAYIASSDTPETAHA